MIELMVVLVIVGLLSGMAVPKFLRADAEAKLEGDAQMMLLNFRTAKQAANKTNLRHWIRLSPPRKIEMWRARFDTIHTFTTDTAKTVRLFVDSLNVKSKFGVVTDLSSAPAVPGYEAPGTTQAYDGLGRSSSVDEDCLDGFPYADTTSQKNNGWAGSKATPPYLITACGSSIADMTEGIAYLSSTGSDDKMYAIAYDRARVQLRLFRYSKGGTPAVWEEL